jgi:hypothetical protein
MIHPKEIQDELPKKSESPDRVYGLQMTKRLERLLLWSENKYPHSGGKKIGESIRASPFHHDGEPIVFPFLVLEAKSEKAKDSFSNIEVQTAFSIRTLLELQQNLRDAAYTKEYPDLHLCPLIWFLSYKGESWRVSAGYTELKNGVQTYVRIPFPDLLNCD